jgi:hypothetical protein
MSLRRIVLHHTQGSLAGLWQILGTEADLQAHLNTSDLPNVLTGLTFPDGHTGTATLIALTPHMVQYREQSAPVPSREPDIVPAL